MKKNALNPLFLKLFGGDADAGTMTYPIPDAEQPNGRASMAKGFPVETMTPVAAGGKPPDGSDINGILRMLSASAQRYESGYVTPWTLEIANAIGGYPEGAMVSLDGADALYVSLMDDNTANPKDSPSLWRSLLGDVVRSREVDANDRAVTNMVGDLAGDPLGWHLNADLKSGEKVKVVGDNWVRSFAEKSYVPLTGAEISGNLSILGQLFTSYNAPSTDYGTFVPNTKWVQDAIVNGNGLNRRFDPENGYLTLPSGLIMQWGLRTSVTGGWSTFDFPMSFPNACLTIQMSEARAERTWGGTTPSPMVYGGNAASKSQFGMCCLMWSTVDPNWRGKRGVFNFLALGY